MLGKDFQACKVMKKYNKLEAKFKGNLQNEDGLTKQIKKIQYIQYRNNKRGVGRDYFQRGNGSWKFLV